VQHEQFVNCQAKNLNVKGNFYTSVYFKLPFVFIIAYSLCALNFKINKFIIIMKAIIIHNLSKCPIDCDICQYFELCNAQQLNTTSWPNALAERAAMIDFFESIY
jgi:hypothetical protein